jgi:lysophospholipase L1-like esterase
MRRVVCLAVVIVALALWFGTGSGASAATVDNYVALGDSYASGVGTNSYTLSASCKRSTYAYPYLLSQQRPNTSLNFVACSGATTADVVNNQVAAVNSTTTIVTISIGGNDLGFGDVITACLQTDCNAILNSTRASADATLSPRLDTVYSAIRSRAAADAKVVVVGYPRLFSSTSCLGALGISTTERSNANLLSDEIDRVTSLRAAAAGFTYKSATAAFTGHAVCSLTPWLNGLNLFNAGESFHPNRAGHSSGYLPLVRQVVG